MKDNDVQDLIEFEKDGEWFSAHYKQLEEQYQKEFVAVKNKQVAAHSHDLESVLAELRKNGIEPAFTLVRFVPEKGVTIIF